jgi:hypothetical protein
LKQGVRKVCCVVLGLLGQTALADSGDAIAVYGMLADSPVFEAGSKNLVAKGNVALLTSEGFLLGDRLTSQDEGKLISLEGSVFIVRKLEVIRASRIVIDRRSGEVLIYDAEIVTDPNLDVKALVDKELLGIAPEELMFESKRQSLLKSLDVELRELREEYVQQKNIESLLRLGDGRRGAVSSADVERRYAIALRKLIRARYESNLQFDVLPPAEKTRYEARRAVVRDLVAANPAYLERFAPGKQVSGYARVTSKMIYRNQEGKYQLVDASMTPCRCDQGSVPIFGLSARIGDVEPGGYAYMKGMTFDVATVPVAYTPWMFFPVKRGRETGFLRPYFYVSRASRVMGIPLFVTLGPYADATLSFNEFSGRGQRYDLEGRFQLERDSRLTVYGETISDRKYLREGERVQRELASDIEKMEKSQNPDPEAIEELRSKRASIVDRRWYVRGKWNLPATEWYSLKVDAEDVSDSKYLADYGKDESTSASLALLSPPQTAKRFLLQETAVEYYGSDVVLSTRAQRVRDIFSLRSGETPYRLPRFELNVLPKNYFAKPLTSEASASWERIVRPIGEGYSDSFDATGSLVPDHQRQENEPILVGDRGAAKVRLTYPFPANNYVNASAFVVPTWAKYSFPAVVGKDGGSPEQTYMLYGSELSIPLYADYSLRSTWDRLGLGRLRHDLVPSFGLNYIPAVWRDRNFPSEFQTFYAEDNVAIKQELVLGVTSSWSIFGEDYALAEQPVPRLDPALDPGVANETVLRMAAERRAIPIELSGQGSRVLVEKSQNDALFSDWARSELEAFREVTYSDDLNSSLIWTGPDFYRKSQSWVSRPLQLGFKTAYNFYAEEAEEEINRRNRWKPGGTQPRTLVNPWSDLEFSIGTSSEPLLPITANYSANWSVRWERWVKHTVGASTALPFGVTGSISRTSSYTPTEKTVVEERTLSYGVGYKPYPWLSVGHNWTRQEKWLDGNLVVDKDNREPDERRSNSQIIALTNVQDCIDVTLKREKDFKKREWEAVWSIGVNMVLFGQKTGVVDVGEAINRKLQEKSKEVLQ